jgi:hypothetical protein
MEALSCSIEERHALIRHFAPRNALVTRNAYLEYLGNIACEEVYSQVCTVCQESFSSAPDDIVETIACRHPFHRNCLIGWMEGRHAQRDSCPNCRQTSCMLSPLKPEQRMEQRAEVEAHNAEMASGVNPRMQQEVQVTFSDAQVHQRLLARATTLCPLPEDMKDGIEAFAQTLVAFNIERGVRHIHPDHKKYGAPWAVNEVAVRLLTRLNATKNSNTQHINNVNQIQTCARHRR